LRGRHDLASTIGGMVRKVLPQVRGVQTDAVVARRSSDHPVKVLGILLHLGVTLMAAGRASVVVRVLQPVLPDARRNSLRWSCNRVNRSRAPIENPSRMACAPL